MQRGQAAANRGMTVHQMGKSAHYEPLYGSRRAGLTRSFRRVTAPAQLEVPILSGRLPRCPVTRIFVPFLPSRRGRTCKKARPLKNDTTVVQARAVLETLYSISMVTRVVTTSIPTVLKTACGELIVRRRPFAARKHTQTQDMASAHESIKHSIDSSRSRRTGASCLDPSSPLRAGQPNAPEYSSMRQYS